MPNKTNRGTKESRDRIIDTPNNLIKDLTSDLLLFGLELGKRRDKPAIHRANDMSHKMTL